MGPDLRAFAQQHFRDDEDAKNDFFSIPLIEKLLGDPNDTTLPETATSVAHAPRRSRHVHSDTALVAHMMPFTGKLARKLFNANFKVHKISGSKKSSETAEDRDALQRAAENLLERRERSNTSNLKITARRAHGGVREIEIEGVGSCRVRAEPLEYLFKARCGR